MKKIGKIDAKDSGVKKRKLKDLDEPNASFGFNLENEARKKKKIKVERMDDVPEISYE